MIPKRIFFVWGVDEKKKMHVHVCIQTWRQYLPDYEIIEINQNSIEYFNFHHELNTNKWFKTVYDRQMWAYVSDYIRIKVLYDNGGIYFDTDVSVVKNMDSFLSNQAFVGIQDNYFVEPAILGAQKGNKLLGDILNFYSDKSEKNIWNTPIFIMPVIFNHYLNKFYGDQHYPIKSEQKIIHYEDITLYPEEYLIPFRWGTRFSPECITENTHTIHWFKGSWLNDETMFFLQNKHLKTIS